MKKLGLFLSVFLISCSGKTALLGKNGFTDPDEENLSDFSSCEVRDTPSALEGTWKSVGRNPNHLYFKRIYRFTENTLVHEVECTKQGKKAFARVQSKIHRTPLWFEVLEAANDVEVFDNGEINFECSASLQEETIHYTFQGSCLVLTKNGLDDFVLVPAE